MTGDSNVHALLGPYVVNAVTDAERAEFEAHLDTCEDCQREVESLRGVVTILADAEATPPPASLRAKVLAEAQRTSQLPPTAQTPPVSDLTEHREARRARWPRIVAAAAAVVAIGAVGTGLVMSRDADPAAVAMERDVMMVASAPDASSMDLDLGASHLVVSERMEAVAAMGYGAPMPTKGMEYQLWLVMNDGSAHPGPTFMPNQNGDFMALMHTGFDGVSGFAVTEEPMGGSASPTGETLATVEL